MGTEAAVVGAVDAATGAEGDDISFDIVGGVTAEAGPGLAVPWDRVDFLQCICRVGYGTAHGEGDGCSKVLNNGVGG